MFRIVFPCMKVDRLRMNEELHLDPELSNNMQGKWVILFNLILAKSLNLFLPIKKAMIPTYLRLFTNDESGGYGNSNNVCLAPRFIFYAIEVARNRELHNQSHFIIVPHSQCSAVTPNTAGFVVEEIEEGGKE